MLRAVGRDVHWRMSQTIEKAIVWSAMALAGLLFLFLMALMISGYPGL
jgi:hypothetical protein